MHETRASARAPPTSEAARPRQLRPLHSQHAPPPPNTRNAQALCRPPWRPLPSTGHGATRPGRTARRMPAHEAVRCIAAGGHHALPHRQVLGPQHVRPPPEQHTCPEPLRCATKRSRRRGPPSTSDAASRERANSKQPRGKCPPPPSNAFAHACGYRPELPADGRGRRCLKACPPGSDLPTIPPKRDNSLRRIRASGSQRPPANLRCAALRRPLLGTAFVESRALGLEGSTPHERGPCHVALGVLGSGSTEAQQ